MASNPRLVAQDTTVAWDGATFLVPKGTIVDIPAGSALETAYGLSNLVSIGGIASDVNPGGDPGQSEPLGDAGGGTG